MAITFGVKGASPTNVDVASAPGTGATLSVSLNVRTLSVGLAPNYTGTLTNGKTLYIIVGACAAGSRLFIEGSFDNANWVVALDSQSLANNYSLAAYAGTTAYLVTVLNADYPYLRVRATSGSGSTTLEPLLIL